MEGYDFDFGGNRKRKKQRKKRIIGWILYGFSIVAVIVLAYFLVRVSIDRTKMPGSSMEPTIAEDTVIVINRIMYRFQAPKRFDVVVFDLGEEEHSFYYVMRVIGLPGETIQIKDGEVYIDGVLLKEPVKELEKMHLAGFAEEPLLLDADEYFVLGDNRNKSEDSRFANIGTITKSQIIGKAWFTEKPFGIVSKLNMEKEEKKKK